MNLRVIECLRKDKKCDNNLPGDLFINRILGNYSITGSYPPIDQPPVISPPIGNF